MEKLSATYEEIWVKNMILLLAYRNIVGNKRKSFFVVLIISIVLMMALATVIIKDNLLAYDVQTIKNAKGSWHYIVPIDSAEVENAINELNGVTDAAAVKRTLVLEDDKESYDCYLLNSDSLDLFINENISGELPKYENEILVPDWYVSKYSINSVPYDISICGLDFKIVGSYVTDADDVYRENVRVFFCAGELETLFNASTYSTSPIDKIIVEGSATLFCFIRLNPGVDRQEVIEQIIELDGVSSFQGVGTYLENGMIRNEALLEAEGFLSKSNYSGNFINDNLSLIITGILLLVLFVAIFVAMNLIISGDVKMCGILQAMGTARERIVFVYLVQSLFLALLSVPLGSALGVAGSYLVLTKSLSAIYGHIIIPWQDVITCVIACAVFTILATLYPALRASRDTCIEAIVGRETKARDSVRVYSPLPVKTEGLLTFVWRYSLRNIAANLKRTFALVLMIALLLSVFTKLSAEIERMWKEGEGRASYTADYVIGYDMNIRPANKFIDPELVDEISAIEGVENVYYQLSVDDDMFESTDGKYDYYFFLEKDILTEQGSKQLELSSPLTRNGYADKVFVQAGISGYGEKELELALDYLIEGAVTLEQLKTERIILLPKYIQWLENMDVPYTNLQVGDQVTIVENQSTSLRDIDIVNEYTFTIGGFVDRLPLPQVNGVSNGFVAIMYSEHLQLLGSSFKGVAELYIDSFDETEISPVLESLCRENQLGFTDNLNDFRSQERENKRNTITISFYTVFAILGMVLFLSVFNILLSNIVMRTREFSLLYIVGARKWQINLSILVEMLSFTVPGVLLGVGTGVLLILTGDLSGEILNIAQLIPVTHILISSSIIVAAAVLATTLGIIQINSKVSIQLD